MRRNSLDIALVRRIEVAAPLLFFAIWAPGQRGSIVTTVTLQLGGEPSLRFGQPCPLIDMCSVRGPKLCWNDHHERSIQLHESPGLRSPLVAGLNDDRPPAMLSLQVVSGVALTRSLLGAAGLEDDCP